MSWLLIAIIAHFIFALVFVFDKYLFSHTHLRPVTYAFYVGLIGGLLSLLLIPFGFNWLLLDQVIISLSAGILFVFAILAFYKSVQMGEVSRIAPVIGGAVPLFTLILTYFFLNERLTTSQLIAFSFLVLGGIVMAWPRKKVRLGLRTVKSPLIKRLPLALLAALLFASSYVLTKIIFSEQPFINGFIWTRFGSVLGAGLLFIWPSANREIMGNFGKIKLRTGELAIISKILSGVAFILLNYAIFLGSVTLVNSLQGIQYVLLLVIALVFSRKFPEIIKKQIGRGAIFQKVIAILLISLGLGILVL